MADDVDRRVCELTNKLAIFCLDRIVLCICFLREFPLIWSSVVTGCGNLWPNEVCFGAFWRFSALRAHATLLLEKATRLLPY